MQGMAPEYVSLEWNDVYSKAFLIHDRIFRHPSWDMF